MLEKINLLEIGFSNVTPEEVLEYIVKSLKKSSKKYYVVTPNPEILVIASNDEFYTKVLNSAKIALPWSILKSNNFSPLILQMFTLLSF